MSLTIPLPASLAVTNRLLTNSLKCHLVDGVNVDRILLTVQDVGKRKVSARLEATLTAEQGHDKEVRSKWELLMASQPVYSFEWRRDSVEEKKRSTRRRELRIDRPVWDDLLANSPELRVTLWVKDD